MFRRSFTHAPKDKTNHHHPLVLTKWNNRSNQVERNSIAEHLVRYSSIEKIHNVSTELQNNGHRVYLKTYR